MIIDDKTIKVYDCPSIDSNSTDNLSYDKHITLVENRLYKSICIEIDNGVEISKIILDVPAFTQANNCAFEHSNNLILILDDIWCIFDIKKLEIIKKVEVDYTGGLFAAYPYQEGIILHCEMSIYRIDKDLNIQWEYTGKDIFVAYDDTMTAFEMKEDRICLYDFLNNYYEIDYDGKTLQYVDSGI